MFYCDSCATERAWPITAFKSRGNCEICGRNEICNDRPSRLLPIPEREEEAMSFFDDPSPGEGDPKVNIAGDATKFVDGVRKIIKILNDNPELRAGLAGTARSQAKAKAKTKIDDDAIVKLINHVVGLKVDQLLVARAVQKLIETRFEPSRKNIIRITYVWSYIVKRTVHAHRVGSKEADEFAKTAKELAKLLKVSA